jgi:hypothetical protein
MSTSDISSAATSSFPDLLFGDGFYKFGYVTTDREQAIELLQTRLGFGEFRRFTPRFRATMDDGRSGEAELECAFATGREIVVEVLQPTRGLVDIFREPLEGVEGFAMRLHHLSVLVDDLDAVKASAAALGITPTLSADVGNGMTFTFMRLPGLGLYVEHDDYRGDSRAFLDSVRKPVGAS